MNPDSKAALRTSTLAAWPMAAAAFVFPWWGAHRYEKIAILLVVCTLTAYHWNSRRAPFGEGWRWLPYSLSLLALALFTGLGILSVENFSNLDLGDISCYLSSFHDSKGWLPGANVISGRPLLAHHSEFLCIPVGWLFKLHPAPVTIQLAQAGSMAVAWMLFRNWIVAKSSAGSGAATGEWIAFGFAFCPCLLTLMLKGFHGVSLAMPFLVLTATAFHDRAWRKFILYLVLLLLAKEVFTFTAISLGGVALFQRRPWRWVVTPIVLGLGYGLFLRFAYFPMMLKDSVYFYASFAESPGAMLARVFSVDSLKYLFQLTLWGGSYAILRSPYLLLALPPIGINMALKGVFTAPNLHYILEPSFWIYFAAATFLIDPARDSEPLLLRHRRLVALVASMLLMNFVTREGLPLYRHHRFETSYREALARIPDGETLSLGVTLEDHLWKLKHWYWIHYAGEYWLAYSEAFACHEGRYALLPRLTGINGALDLAEEERLIRCREELERDPGYRKVWGDSVLLLFVKRD